MNELQTLESIIASKPDRATHFQNCDGNCYFQSDAFGMTDLYNNEPVKYENIVNIRSLSDIQTQISQLKEIESLKEQLASANLETTRKGYWLGFVDARCNPEEINILTQWKKTLVFNKTKQLEGKG
jgi:hypothetical protein